MGRCASVKRRSGPAHFLLRYDVVTNEQESLMKVLFSAVFAAGLLAGCISSSSPPPPAKTTVVVPQGSGATVVCQNGNPPPCD